MPFWEIVFIAIGLGTDAFSVGICVGSGGRGIRRTFRASFHFGLFQFFMPILGWLACSQLAGLLSKYNSYVAAAIILAIAAHMLDEARRHPSGNCSSIKDVTRGLSLVGLSLATSIDAFGVGLGIGLIGKPLVWPCTIIGIVAAAMTLTGVTLGSRLSAVIGKKAEIFGSLVLMLIAIKIAVGG